MSEKNKVNEADLVPATSGTAVEKPSDNTEKTHTAIPDSGEIGGPKGLEPTRYGDWEKAGRCIDF